jgi:hypothetical protein
MNRAILHQRLITPFLPGAAIAVIGVLISLAFPACSSGKPVADSSSAEGVVTGTAFNCAMAPEGTHPQVTLTAGSRIVATQVAAGGDVYRFVARAGQYRLQSSESPMAVDVVVHARQVAQVNLQPSC